jgi:hypothetical protein
MGQKSHLRLPALASWRTASPPTLDEARRALGGRTRSDGREGAGATVDEPRRGRSPGVVLCAAAGEVDVWIGEGLIARVAQVELDEPAELFRAVAADIRRYWALREGDRVRVDGALGTLREQCRYGALVERDEAPGKVVAVGFRRLEPARGA